MELVAGADGELDEDLVQVVLDRARAHEQLSGDLGVGQAAAGQPSDLSLPYGEPGRGLRGALADSLAGRMQLARGSFLVSREAARAMVAQGLGGDIVYIASKNARPHSPAPERSAK